MTNPEPRSGTRRRTGGGRGARDAVSGRARGGLVVSQRGDPAADAVVLVHGIGVSERYFRPLAAELAADRRVLLPDLPGFGRSPRPRTAPDVEQMADDVLRSLDDLGVGRAVLVGHSMGAQVVLAAMRRDPGRARAGLLIGPVVDPASPTAAGQAVRLARNGLHEPFRVNAVITGDYLRTGPRWYLAVLPAMLAFDTGAAAAEIADPLLVVRGEHDVVCSRGWARSLAVSARHGELREVPGAAHVAMATDPVPIARWVRQLSGTGTVRDAG